MAEINLKASLQYEMLQPYKLELTRGQKGAYGWTITVHRETKEDVIADTGHIDSALRTGYAAEAPPAPEE